MRAVSAQALAALNTQNGIEPANIVEIQWTNTLTIQYCDKNISSSIQGKILSMSSFDDTVNLDGHNSTQTVTITLDDTDGSIKEIFNVNDIHKRPVKVFQWFTNIPLADKFLVFEGQVNSPIVWKEGDRSLSFDIVSKIEDQEVGFAVEEGLFDLVPDDLIGKEWPLPFGTVLRVPALKLDSIPSGVLMDGTGVADPSILNQMAEINKKIQELGGLALLAFYTALAAYHTAQEVGGFDTPDPYYEGLGDQFTATGNDYLAQQWKAQQDLANLESTYQAQLTFQKKKLRITNGKCFPQGASTSMRLNGVSHTGQMVDGDFIVNGVVHPATEGVNYQGITTVPIQESTQTGGSQSQIQKLGFVWVSPDVPVQLTTPVPVRYIASMIPATVLNVWAYKNYGDARFLVQVPSEYYTVSIEAFGDLAATVVTLNQPLTCYDKGWSDSLYIDEVSSVGPNTVDIMAWVIENYTALGIDGTSFNTVRNQLGPFPSNFCLFTHKNVVAFLGELAFQSRCALTLKNDTFYLLYLPAEPTPVKVITEDNILVNTLEITHTSTEEIVTRLTASYKTDYSVERPGKIVLRNNQSKYGLHPMDVDWYIYNAPDLVDIAATFWIIRKSNTWKVLKFKTPLNMIQLETFDGVTIDFASNWSQIGSVTGIVQNVKLDTDQLNLEFEVWIPVRLGEMKKYNFAWPIDSDVNIFEGDEIFQKPGAQATGSLSGWNGACDTSSKRSVPKSPNRKRLTSPKQNPGATSGDFAVEVAPVIDGLDTTPKPKFDYDYRTYTVSPFDPSNIKPFTAPAQIKDYDEATKIYTILLYLTGLDAQGTQTVARDAADGPRVPDGTWVEIANTVWVETDPSNSKNTVVKAEKTFVVSSGKNVFPGIVRDPHTPGEDEMEDATLYDVDIYADGIDGEFTTVAVKQLQIADEEIIPNGTWVFVLQGPNDEDTGKATYTMQVPVYLADETE